MSGSLAPESAEERFFYDDPAAPAVNVPLQPGVAAVLFDDEKRILILKRISGPYWSLPGGRQEAGESAPECCVREAREETGLDIRVTRLIGLYTNPRSICSYPDGNVHQSYIALFGADIVGGQLQHTDEMRGWHWMSVEEFDQGDYLLLPDNALCCRDAWADRPEAFVR